MKVIVICALIAVAFAQDDDSVKATVEWPQNDKANAGALVSFAYADIGEGSCQIDLPSSVLLFHAMNGHIVNDDFTNPIEGNYKVAAPAGWEMINGTLNALILFNRDDIFNITEITFTCDPDDVAEISIYSFPQNHLVKEASSNVHYRPGFHVGDVLTITLPAPVARFNITGADSRYVIDSEGGLTWTVSGFVNEEGIDDMKEVHFSLDYATNEDGSVGDNWFSAGQVTASVTREEPPERR